MSKLFKHVRLCVLVAILSIGTLSTVWGYEVTPQIEKVYKELYESQAKNWLCYWEMYVPDGIPHDSKSQSVPGKRGISALEFRKGVADEFLRVTDFLDDFTLNIRLTSGGSLEYGLTELLLYSIITNDDEDAKNYFSPASRFNPSLTAYDFSISTQNITTINQSLKFSEVNLYGNTALQLILEEESGYIFFKDWDNSRGFIYNNARTNSTFFNKLRLILFPVQKIATGYTLSGRTEREYCIYFSQDEGIVDVSNLYGLGAEMSGDMLNYTFTDNELTPSTARLVLNPDGCVTLDSPVPGMLSFDPIIGSYNSGNNKITYKPLNKDSYYTDYVIIDPSELESCNAENNSEFDLVKFYDRFQSADFKTPVGQFETDNKCAINPHWDTFKGNKPGGALKIMFGKHYIVPVHYKYSTYKDIEYDEFEYNFTVSAPVEINELTLNIPVEESDEPGADLIFVLKDYGNNELEPDVNYLYIRGNLVTDLTDFSLYLVRGKISDRESSDLADLEKGHIKGRLISSDEFDYHTFANTNSTTSNEVSFLIPENILPEVEGSGDKVYTLYAKYLDPTDQTYRFRTLATLDDAKITTGNADRMSDNETNAYILSDCGLMATSGIQVFDLLGRHICSLNSGQSATLRHGLYLIKSGSATSKVLIK